MQTETTNIDSKEAGRKHTVRHTTRSEKSDGTYLVKSASVAANWTSNKGLPMTKIDPTTDAIM